MSSRGKGELQLSPPYSKLFNVKYRYKYSKDDEEIYKEFMEINNELIPHILKTEGKLTIQLTYI